MTDLSATLTSLFIHYESHFLYHWMMKCDSFLIGALANSFGPADFLLSTFHVVFDSFQWSVEGCGSQPLVADLLFFCYRPVRNVPIDLGSAIEPDFDKAFSNLFSLHIFET